MSHYDTLGLPRHASPSDIKAAFRKLSWEAHPDRGGRTDDMAALNKAYEVLSDPELREQYDRTGDDRVLPTLDYKARDAVMNAVMQLIERDENEDLVEHMRQGFAARQAEIRRDLAAIPARMAKMKRRSARVRCNGTANLVQMIVAQRIAQLQHAQKDLEEALPIIDRALEMVAEHEWDAEVLMSLPGEVVYINTWANP